MKKIKPDGNKTYYILGGLYEVDRTPGGALKRTVTYYPIAGAMRVNIVGGSNTLYYLLKDHLGSASVVTDSTGAVVGENRYYPYGETRFTSGTMYTDKLYTGQREMAGLGIYHYQARFYSPKLGRFLSPDTIVPGMSNPQAFNRYMYVLGNPIRYNDPTGHVCSDPDDPDQWCENGGNYPSNATPLDVDPVILSTGANDLLEFADDVGVTPEVIIIMAIYHEMAGWVYASPEDKKDFAQHFSNRFVWYAQHFCYNLLTYNCMLNFFMDTYQTIITSFVGNYSSHPEDFLKYETWAPIYVNAGTNIMDHFWENIDPSFDPVNNPEDAKLPFNVGVVYADPLIVALGHQPVSGVDFLVVSPSICEGQRSYSLILSL